MSDNVTSSASIVYVIRGPVIMIDVTPNINFNVNVTLEFGVDLGDNVSW